MTLRFVGDRHFDRVAALRETTVLPVSARHPSNRPKDRLTFKGSHLQNFSDSLPLDFRHFNSLNDCNRATPTTNTTMQKVIGLALVLVGIVLLYYGYQEGESLASTVKETITGSPTDRSLTLVIAGIICACLGIGLVFTGGRRR